MSQIEVPANISGSPVEGFQDQYADGKAADVWELYIGDEKTRTRNYKNFLVGLLRKNNCKRILDVACGTGIDSIMLLEEGFDVTSVDASDKMLKYALKQRWKRRKEAAFDNWIIEEANWLTLYEDIEELVGDGFDAVICIGNSFSQMISSYSDQPEPRQAIKNFKKCLKIGGVLLVDHRNYDSIMNSGYTPTSCIYYNSKHLTDIKTSVLYVNGKPAKITMDYLIEKEKEKSKEKTLSEFTMSSFPYPLDSFKEMLFSAFGNDAPYTLYGDFKDLAENDVPNIYIHYIEKPHT